MNELKEVSWKRSYPQKLENEGFLLIRKNWGFRLIYDVYKKREGNNILLGTCHVMQREIKKENLKIVVKELDSKSPELKKRMEEVQKIIRENIN